MEQGSSRSLIIVPPKLVKTQANDHRSRQEKKVKVKKAAIAS